MTKAYEPHRRVGNTARIFRDYDKQQHVLYSQWAFLHDVWDVPHNLGKPLFAFMGFKNARSGNWTERWIDLNNEPSTRIDDLLERYSRWDYDQYFCPNFFSEPRRKKELALPTRYAWCDMDESDPSAYRPRASLVWETSPGRFQGLWLWDQAQSPDEAEAFSKALAYRHGGDRNGWSHTKMLRLIGSVNHKPQYDKPFVRLVSCDWREVEARPKPLLSRRKASRLPPTDIEVDPTVHARADVIARYRKKLHLKARYLMDNRKVFEPNRSACVYFMISALHEAGASTNEIASVIWGSPYFFEKHGQHIGKLNEEITRVVGKIGSGK